MTIIAVQGRTMAADTWAWRGGVGYPVAPGHLKIVRAPDGSLVGSAGDASDLTIFRAWVIAGMDFGNRPTLRTTSEEERIDWLWLKKSGELWRGNHLCDMHPVGLPGGYAIGINDAVMFCEGAMCAGMDIEQAVRMTIHRCAYVGGEVQVERLAPLLNVKSGRLHSVEQGSWV